MVSPATSALSFKLGQERKSSVAPTPNAFHDEASHLQCAVGNAVQHCGQEASFRAPTGQSISFDYIRPSSKYIFRAVHHSVLPSSELHEDDQVQSISLDSNEKVHSRRNPDISGKAIAFVAEST